MMKMVVESINSVNLDVESRFKALWVTNSLDGSEYYLATQHGHLTTLITQSKHSSKPSPTK